MLSEPPNPLFQGVTAELYRAAIGPRGQDAYLRHFLRFDLAGRTHLTWHWPACCLTLNWLIYRKLWRGVFTYMAILLGLMLLIFGVGTLLLAYSNAMGVALLLLFLVAACVVPGLYANAWYYNWCNERISAVLRDAKDLQSACAVLAAEASTERRWGSMALVNGVLILLAAGVLAVVLRQPPAVDEDEVILTSAPAPVLAASAAASEPASAASAPAPAASVPEAVASAVVAQPTEAPVEPLVEKLPEPVPPPVAVKEKPPVSAKPAPVQPVVPAKPPAEKPRAAAETVRSVRGNWFVQVGAFAQEANAQKTLVTLKAAGLPTTADTQVGKNGRLTRVRVGPFASEAGAEQAAAQVRALELPAVLVKP